MRLFIGAGLAIRVVEQFPEQVERHLAAAYENLGVVVACRDEILYGVPRGARAGDLVFAGTDYAARYVEREFRIFQQPRHGDVDRRRIGFGVADEIVAELHAFHVVIQAYFDLHAEFFVASLGFAREADALVNIARRNARAVYVGERRAPVIVEYFAFHLVAAAVERFIDESPQLPFRVRVDHLPSQLLVVERGDRPRSRVEDDPVEIVFEAVVPEFRAAGCRGLAVAEYDFEGLVTHGGDSFRPDGVIASFAARADGLYAQGFPGCIDDPELAVCRDQFEVYVDCRQFRAFPAERVEERERRVRRAVEGAL